eukprot:2385928-Ditylum_brightwellii.AAC.1
MVVFAKSIQLVFAICIRVKPSNGIALMWVQCKKEGVIKSLAALPARPHLVALQFVPGSDSGAD